MKIISVYISPGEGHELGPYDEILQIKWDDQWNCWCLLIKQMLKATAS